MNQSLKQMKNGEGLHIVPSFEAKNVDRIKNLAELEDGKKLNGSSNEDQPVKVTWRLQRRKIQFPNLISNFQNSNFHIYLFNHYYFCYCYLFIYFKKFHL